MKREFGYIPNKHDTYQFISSLPDYHDEMQSFFAQDDGQDRFLYRALVKCLKKKFPQWVNGERLISYHQGRVGSCCGISMSQLLNHTQAIDCMIKLQPETYKHMSSGEGTYGLVREACGMRRGDGAYGSGAARAITTMGTLWMKEYGEINLDVPYDANRCRRYGSRWCPDDLKVEAKKHLIKSANQVKSAKEAWAIIGGNDPIQVCSNRGFQKKRDRDGFCKPYGNWNHAMAIIGRRTTQSGRRGFLILNSWGENWCSGPLFEDQPKGSFWADYKVVDYMLKQGDSYNVIDLNGFKPKRLDWSII